MLCCALPCCVIWTAFAFADALLLLLLLQLLLHLLVNQVALLSVMLCRA